MKRLMIYSISFLVFISLACQFTPTAQPTATSEPTATPTKEVLPTIEQPTPLPEPTSEPTAEPVTKPTSIKNVTNDQNSTTSGNYHEEFDTDINNINEFIEKYPNWKNLEDPKFPFILTGNNQHNAKFFTQNGSLVVKLAGNEETHMKIFENDHNYKDVVVSTEFENLGASHNAVALLCRVNKMGWYEFQIGSDGFWHIYRYDTTLKADKKNPYIFIGEGASTDIITGYKKNTFALSCIGNQLKFYINDKEMKSDKMNIPQTKLEEFKKYPEGSTGLGIYTWHDTPGNVEVHFEYFDAKIPQ
jgi:hypothetical protein